MPRSLSDPLVRDTPLLAVSDDVATAVRALLDCDLPALPVVDDAGRLRGVFGEREFLSAVFPGYLDQLRGAGFLTRSLEDALEKRAACARERVELHMTSDHVEAGPDFADAQIAETFLHHRVLIVPVVDDDGAVRGIITRADFFAAVAGRLLADR